MKHCLILAQFAGGEVGGGGRQEGKGIQQGIGKASMSGEHPSGLYGELGERWRGGQSREG